MIYSAKEVKVARALIDQAISDELAEIAKLEELLATETDREIDIRIGLARRRHRVAAYRETLTALPRLPESSGDQAKTYRRKRLPR